MGVFNHLSDLFDCTLRTKKFKKRKQLQTVEIKVKMDCEGCERKVKKAVEGMKGVNEVDIEAKQSKVVVIGYVEPRKVLQRIRATGKKAEFWPYVRYDVVPHPYAPGTYDKKAPPGYVRNVLQDPEASALARANSMEERFYMAFSDDNPNSCSIM
ncbi:PREDICTED: heavy metal-associated isoprenylated plant protein 27-like [Nelumbo nucifera]|uniref:Heavy metal-associated isoprenylated plant protein 27-like n=2 Tax=Nelumbo nucifera TaxID=4432 RepID=A0A1U8ALE6_NELNU|nr:PREDICTED: heavy metal-associated isoprenylated plant protein 27-like [Nelumbo nucifera]DAD46761.1 TPA_asm: hypothetical protein HUJ06_016698 [Nelumbo nucifera]